MKRSCHISLLLGAVFVLLFTGCSARPDEQIAQAELALKQAEEQHAEHFATEDWNAAKQAWDQAQTALEQQKYGEATTLLLKASTRFRKARDIAQGRKEDAIREIQGIHSAAEKRLKDLQEAVDSGKIRVAASKRKTYEESVKDFEAKLTQVTTKLEGGEFGESKFLAQTTLRQIWETQKELEGKAGR